MSNYSDLNIGVKGNLKLTLTDALSGKVLHVDEGPNLVLNTGIEDICHLLAGDTQVPVDLASGQYLYETNHAMLHLPIYGQFGRSSKSPTSDDASIYPNGALDPNLASPIQASNIIKSTASFPLSTTLPPVSNKITVQFTLTPTQGNGPGGTSITYREAVLMCKVADSPIQYSWFARRVFGDITKSPTSILTSEWTFTFVVSRS